MYSCTGHIIQVCWNQRRFLVILGCKAINITVYYIFARTEVGGPVNTTPASLKRSHQTCTTLLARDSIRADRAISYRLFVRPSVRHTGASVKTVKFRLWNLHRTLWTDWEKPKFSVFIASASLIPCENFGCSVPIWGRRVVLFHSSVTLDDALQPTSSTHDSLYCWRILFWLYSGLLYVCSGRSLLVIVTVLFYADYSIWFGYIGTWFENWNSRIYKSRAIARKPCDAACFPIYAQWLFGCYLLQLTKGQSCSCYSSTTGSHLSSSTKSRLNMKQK